MEAVRIIKEMREATNGLYPRFALWENVPGAFSSNRGEDFRIVCEELIKIVEPSASMPSVPQGGWSYSDCYRGDGWSLAYRVFDAQYWGVPQRRRRIHLVLDLRGERAREVLFERKGVRGYFAEGRTPWKSLAAYAERSVGTADCDGSVPYTLKIRSGCEGGGKGALIQEDMSATLATNNDQYLFQPIKLCLDDQGESQITVRTDGKTPTLRAEMHGNVPCVLESAGFKAGQGVKARSIGWDEERTPTLASESGGNSVPSVCVKCYDARGNGDGETISTLTGDHENRITDYTSVLVQKSYAMQGFGDYKESEVSSGLKARDYKDSTDLVCGVDCRNMNEYSELYPTIQAKPNGVQSLNFSGSVRIRYIVRRLTPTECARLQGFADRWGDIDHKYDFSDEEYEFWHDVRNTHAAINGKAVKEYTKAQMLMWYNKLHTDSAEYKMWGNGIALPPALYCMQGIADALSISKEAAQ